MRIRNLDRCYIFLPHLRQFRRLSSQNFQITDTFIWMRSLVFFFSFFFFLFLWIQSEIRLKAVTGTFPLLSTSPKFPSSEYNTRVLVPITLQRKTRNYIHCVSLSVRKESKWSSLLYHDPLSLLTEIYMHDLKENCARCEVVNCEITHLLLLLRSLIFNSRISQPEPPHMYMFFVIKSTSYVKVSL